MTITMLLIKATVILGAAALINRLAARHTSAAVRHGIWTLALIGALLLPAASLIVPAGSIDLPILPAAVTPAAVATPATASMADATDGPARLDRPSPAADAPASAPVRVPSWQTIAIAGYLAGALLLLVRLAADHLSARRLVARAIPVADPGWTAMLAACGADLGVREPVRLRQSTEAVMPMAIGLRRATILVPPGADTWSADRRQAVLRHELAHVVRHDCLTQAIASLAVAAYWIHPGVWWAARRLQMEREFACDDLVLAAGAAPREYAGHLLDIAYRLRAHHAPALAVAMARHSQLEGRLLAVLDEARNRATPGRTRRLLASATALALVLPLAALTASVRVSARALPLEPTTVEDRGPVQAQASASMTGTWELQPGRETGEVYLELRQGRSSSGRSIAASTLEGLSTAQRAGTGSATFTLRRDAGTFTFTGSFTNGVGAGTYSFTPSATFASALAKRGVSAPTAQEQHELAKHDVGLALVDELKAQGYGTPSIEALVRCGHHGVTADYVKAMGGLGYSVGTIDALVRLRDHGVTPDYVRGLAAAGLPKLTADVLVNARDHGVTPDFIGALHTLGYTSLGIDALVNARDHGVTPDFVEALRTHGYTKLSLEELVNARDHGVTPDYITAMAAQGYNTLSMAALVNARDHGVSADYVKGMADLGYKGLPLEELVSLRDHGVTPDRARKANERAGTHLPPDLLRSLADGGLR